LRVNCALSAHGDREEVLEHAAGAIAGAIPADQIVGYN
jgi:hypothetical protein